MRDKHREVFMTPIMYASLRSYVCHVLKFVCQIHRFFTLIFVFWKPQIVGLFQWRIQDFSGVSTPEEGTNILLDPAPPLPASDIFELIKVVMDFFVLNPISGIVKYWIKI